MANTYSSLFYQFVFSIKNRERWIVPGIEERVWAYLAGIAVEDKMHPVAIGGMDDHIHLLLNLPTAIAPSKAVQLIKGGSSLWIHKTFPSLKAFGWQDGYGVFTVSKSALPEVEAYIRNQREHHRNKTFQEEYLAFLDRHGVAFDEGHVWG